MINYIANDECYFRSLPVTQKQTDNIIKLEWMKATKIWIWKKELNENLNVLNSINIKS